jgi:SOS-response transcriptional repressor LexA
VMLPLTERQSQVLAFIHGFMAKKGFAPSLEQIAAGLELSSLATVHKHLENLKERGYITRAWNRSRSITVLVDGPICPTCKRPLRGESNPQIDRNTVEIGGSRGESAR